MSDILSNTSPDAISRLHSGQRLLSFNLLSEHRSGLQRWHHTSLNPCRPRVSVPCSFDRQGGFLVRPCGLRLVAVSLLLLCPLLTSPIGSGSMTLPSAIPDGPWEISQGQTQNVPCIDAGFIKHTPCGWRTSQSRARSSRVYHTSYPVPVRRPARLDWASSRPHLVVGALALLLAFGSAITWHEDFHLARSVPCLAHTPAVSRAR